MLRPELLALRRYVPGKPISHVQAEYGLETVHKLASNENPLGPSPKAIQAASECLSHLELYPDATAAALREGIAEHWGLEAERIVIGDGSDELLRLLASMFISSGDEAIMADLTFGVYSHAVNLMGGTAVRVPLQDFKHDLPTMLSLCSDKTKMVFICNPNNPTGTYLTKPELTHFMEQLPEHIVVVLDEAYYEFVTHPERADGLDYLRSGHNVVVLRTFSKAYGLAGLRVGYAMTTPEYAAMLNTVRAPFNVNTVAQVAGLAALDDHAHLAATVSNNTTERAKLVADLQSLGCTVVPSEANFVLANVNVDSRDLYPRLLRHGVVVRPGYEFGLLTYLRISVGTTEQMRACFAALQQELLVLGKLDS